MRISASLACIVALGTGCTRSPTAVAAATETQPLTMTSATVEAQPPPSTVTSLFGDTRTMQTVLGGIKGASLGGLSCPDGVLDVLDLVGRCDSGRTIANRRSAERAGALPPGDEADYGFTIALRGKSPATVRVRSNAVFPRANLQNVLGDVRAGVCVRATAMLKDAAINGGIARAIRVRDSRGVVCRGYVSAMMYQE